MVREFSGLKHSSSVRLCFSRWTVPEAVNTRFSILEEQ